MMLAGFDRWMLLFGDNGIDLYYLLPREAVALFLRKKVLFTNYLIGYLGLALQEIHICVLYKPLFLDCPSKIAYPNKHMPSPA